jgi:hypothetical protein
LLLLLRLLLMKHVETRPLMWCPFPSSLLPKTFRSPAESARTCHVNLKLSWTCHLWAYNPRDNPSPTHQSPGIRLDHGHPRRRSSKKFAWRVVSLVQLGPPEISQSSSKQPLDVGDASALSLGVGKGFFGGQCDGSLAPKLRFGGMIRDHDHWRSVSWNAQVAPGVGNNQGVQIHSQKHPCFFMRKVHNVASKNISTEK